MPEAGRVVTGTAKGGRILAPGPGTRPLTDRIKQALFATLEAELPEGWDGPFLDLFAGSGSAGIEALSRGATACVFVERDARAAAVIVENLRRLGLAGPAARVTRLDAIRFLDGAPAAVGGPFVAALVDPPYGDVAIVAALERLGDPSRRWLAEGAVVVAKHFWKDPVPRELGTLAWLREKRFGETLLTFYQAEWQES